jgi:predicted transcriptional regulator
MGEENTELLKKEIAGMFESAGFDVKLENDVLSASIDLQREEEDFRVICVFRDMNTEDVFRHFIQNVEEKNKEIKANKVIVVILGLEVLGEDRAVAEENDIIVWEKENIDEMLDCFREDKDDGVSKLMSVLGIDSYTDKHQSFSPARYS